MNIEVSAPAKINLFLDIVEKRKDGFHNIKSIMQSVGLCDKITLDSCADDFSVSCTNTSLACDKSNLVCRAADLFFETFNIENRNINIKIEKNIPMSAGLAGGSTDCAATLIGLNELYKTKLDENELCSLGAKLGADVPFCIKLGTAVTEGIGEIITPLPAFSSVPVIIAISRDESISTPKAYAELDRIYDSFSKRKSNEAGFQKILSALMEKNISALANSLYNIFEDAILQSCPGAVEIKETMLSNSALGALMSGSGPSVFGIFKNDADAKTALETLKSKNIQCYLCKTIETR